MAVTARVMPVARLTGLREPRELRITAEDVARGYVLVTEPTTFAVAGNTPGYVLDVTPTLPLAHAIDVYGLPASVHLDQGGGSIVTPATLATHEALALTYRVQLHPGAQPGTYPWPLHLSVHPL